jgi:hypothetical protein
MINVDGWVEWLMLSIGTLFVVLLPFGARAYWHNKNKNREPMIFLGNLFYNNEKFQRAHVRTGIPIMVTMGIPFFLLGVLMALLNDEIWERRVFGSTNMSGFALLTLVIIMAASAVLYWSIMLYNRPKHLVPPDLRNELGIVEEWRVRRDDVRRSAK